MAAKSRARPRSRRTKTQKVRYTYDSDTDSGNDSSQQSRPSRRSQRIQTYNEDSDESASDLESLSHDSDPSRPVRRRQRYVAPSTRGKTSKRKRNTQTSSRPKQNYELFKRRKPNTSASSTKSSTIEIPASVKIPPWQQLPYQVLQQIMKYAATTASTTWLCDLSLLCRSFHEACVSALLYSPPLLSATTGPTPAHRLLEILARDQSKTSTNYRNQIKCLDVEVKQLLIRSGGIDLLELLSYTPLLEQLHLYHSHDSSSAIWALPSHSRGRKWSYPEELFQKLDDLNIKLKSWEWNGRFPSGPEVLKIVSSAHVRPCFSEVQELSFHNIELPEKTTPEDLAVANTLLISALHRLPNLKSLTFRRCNILNDATMAQLPPALTSLKITDCLDLTSEQLSIYFSTSGSLLKSLTLAGNQSLSLAFLTILSTLCPRLQHLNLDLTYTDPKSSKDVYPLYDDVIPDGPPTWPSSLISISVENLRQISLAQTEELFTSLVDFAPNLPQLRKIEIKAIIKDASWRDRAEIRKKWFPRLEEVFLDTSEPMRMRSIPKPVPKLPEVVVEKKVEKETEVPLREKKPVGRQSQRLAHLKQLSIDSQVTNTSDSADSFSDSNASFSPSAPAPLWTTALTSGKAGVHGDRTGQLTSEGGLYIQGRCDSVVLILSDQRPAQEQYHERDFLDSERSGDEEWRGRDLDFD